MPRIKQVPLNYALRDEIARDIKATYGAYLSRRQLIEYLKIGKCRDDIIDQIPYYNLTPGRRSYSALDVATWLTRQRVGTICG